MAVIVPVTAIAAVCLLIYYGVLLIKEDEQRWI